MKKTLLFLFTAALFFTIFTFEVSAVSYTVKEAGVTIDLPSDIVIFTRETDPNDPNLKKYGISYDYLQKLFKNSNIYFNGVYPDTLNDFLVTVDPHQFSKRFDQMSNTEMKVYISSFKAGAKLKKSTVTKSEFTEINGITYFKVNSMFSNNNTTIYNQQYILTYHKKTTAICFSSNNGEITPEEEQNFAGIMATAVFDNYNKTDSGSGVKASSKDTKENDTEYWIIFYFILWLILFSVLSIPMILFRFAIKRKPMKPSKALLVSIVYFLITGAIFTYFILKYKVDFKIGIADVFVIFMNYYVLKKGYKETLLSTYSYVSPQQFSNSYNQNPYHPQTSNPPPPVENNPTSSIQSTASTYQKPNDLQSSNPTNLDGTNAPSYVPTTTSNMQKPYEPQGTNPVNPDGNNVPSYPQPATQTDQKPFDPQAFNPVTPPTSVQIESLRKTFAPQCVFCCNCGTSISIYSGFCYHCGERVKKIDG
jgi:hypothetical protein